MSQGALSPKRALHRAMPFDPVLLRDGLGRCLLATLLSAFGSGFVFALFVLYCVHLRHVSPLVAGAILGWEVILSLFIAPYYGTMTDRYGPSRILMWSVPIASVAISLVGFAPTLPWIVAVMTVFSLAGAGMYTAGTVLLTRVVAEEHRTDAFGLNFMLLNVGIGLGSLCGALIVNLHDLVTFQIVYVLSGSFLFLSAFVLFTLRRHGGPPKVAEAHEAHLAEGWREVVRDHRLVRFMVPSLLLMVCGYGSIEAGLPLFVTGVAHLSVHIVGLLIAFNTSTIIVSQLFVLKGIRNRSRSLLGGVVGVAWGVSWLLATSSLFVGVLAAISFLCIGQIFFALGETIWQPIAPGIVNSLAPEHLRGRYNATIGLTWGFSGAIGPVIASLFFQLHQGRLWTIVLAAGAVAGGLGVTTMRRVLTAEQDGRVPAASTTETPRARGGVRYEQPEVEPHDAQT